MWAISSTARSKTAWFAADGLVLPLTLRTYCNAAACTSSWVAGGSKLCRVRMLRHMPDSVVTEGIARKTRPRLSMGHRHPIESSLLSKRFESGGREDQFMEIGLHIADFTFPDGPAALRGDLDRIVSTAEQGGFTKVSVMDHLWQIGLLG